MTESYEPHTLQRWTMPDGYSGKVWPVYYSAGVSRSRDSDALERSNFAVMLRRLGGESDTVIVVRERHWAAGWAEWVAIHQDDERALRIADELAASLVDYPVADEAHFAETEDAEAQETWEHCYTDVERIDYIRRYREQFDFRTLADMLKCARGKWFGGYAGELLA